MTPDAQGKYCFMPYYRKTWRTGLGVEFWGIYFLLRRLSSVAKDGKASPPWAAGSDYVKVHFFFLKDVFILSSCKRTSCNKIAAWKQKFHRNALITQSVQLFHSRRTDAALVDLPLFHLRLPDSQWNGHWGNTGQGPTGKLSGFRGCCFLSPSTCNNPKVFLSRQTLHRLHSKSNLTESTSLSRWAHNWQM